MSYWIFSLVKRRQLEAYDAPEWYPKTTPGNLMVLLLATAAVYIGGCMVCLVWAISCLVPLPFMPEFPRWLLDQGSGQNALQVLARVNASGDTRDDLVRLQYCEICDTIRYEREPDETRW
ncbi:hypothetical protein P8C59_000462 [Phyllachora maydis]|uniref:Uncharacterized protein n=1 Tax=Phyllachora maydis TaxID=1825666 RepID=A0AAD9HW46_9PEZI|nr:hypothetical protein P8C59_000462 [Phyllachora maydis]